MGILFKLLGERVPAAFVGRIVNGSHRRSIKGFHSESGSGLRILFFGSDEFSIHALERLKCFQKRSSGVVDDIQVVTRKPKWCGRGNSILKHTPIVDYCKSIGLRAPLTCDTKEDMLRLNMRKKNGEHDAGFNMIIAVSFGKLIPSDLLKQMQYSLNIHPSLLPKYKGASPIQYSLLNRDETVGVTIQTLHPDKFDHGSIIAQTEPLITEELLSKGKVSKFLDFTPKNTAILMDQLGLEGGNLLVKVLEKQLYRDATKYAKPDPSIKSSYASRITTEMKHIKWQCDSASTLVNKLHTLGPIFAFKKVVLKNKTHVKKRIIFHDFEIIDEQSRITTLTQGQFIYDDFLQSIIVQCCDGHCLKVDTIQFEGYKIETAKDFMKKLPKRCGTKQVELIFL